MDQRKTTLHGWITEMAKEETPGDEIALYILSRMYHKHAFVYTQMFWWTTLLYTWPVQEKEIMDECEIVLVYMKPGVFGELQKIRPLTTTITQFETDRPADLPIVISQNAEEISQPSPKATASKPVITEGACGDNPVPTGSTPISTITGTTPQVLQGCANLLDMVSHSSTSLPKIDIFMTQGCSIPLIRCDFDSVLKAVNTHNKMMQKNTGSTSPVNKTSYEVQSDKTPEVRTSSRPRTVINYKQFLEEYADAPPTRPRKKREIDLKCKPSKQRIAADKFRSKFITKPMHMQRLVRHKITKKKPGVISKQTADPQPSTSDTPDPKSRTLLTPATAAQTKDAIEALLMLGDIPAPEKNPDDNASIIPITGIAPNRVLDTSQADEQAPEPPQTNQTLDPLSNTLVNPTPGSIIGTAVKTDGEPDNDTQEVKIENKDLNIKQYGITRKYKLDWKFKCKICSEKLSSVQEFNQHCSDNHPPLPCPDCPHVFISPQTLAKHRYTHADIMYECADCGRGFTFKSQLESHRKVHLKMAGFVCFKPKCGKRFKRELELNAHLIVHDKKEIKCEHCD